MLLSDKALATIISGYEKKLKVIRLELERTKRDSVSDAKTAKAVCDAKVVGEQARRSACLRDLKRRDELLSKALGKSAPWYQSPQLHFVLGSLISGGVCAAAVRF